MNCNCENCCGIRNIPSGVKIFFLITLAHINETVLSHILGYIYIRLINRSLTHFQVLSKAIVSHIMISNFLNFYFEAGRAPERGRRRNHGGSEYDSSSMMSSDLDSTSFIDSDEESRYLVYRFELAEISSKAV